MTNEPMLPTPAEVLATAWALLRRGETVADGSALVALARELREGSRQQAPGERLTLHDVEGIVCAHGRVAVRRKNTTPAGWFMHTDDGSNCEAPQPELEHKRRMSAELAALAHERWVADVQDVPRRYVAGADASTYGDLAPRQALYGDPAAHLLGDPLPVPRQQPAPDETAQLDTSRLRPQVSEALLAASPREMPQVRYRGTFAEPAD